MKLLLSWILLAVYLNAAAQTLLPMVQDGLAHMFFWQEHLEHVHNGHIHSHHVADETATVAGISDHPSRSEHPPASFLKDNLSIHEVPALPLWQKTVPLLFSSSLYPAPDSSRPEVFFEVIVPPPDQA